MSVLLPFAFAAFPVQNSFISNPRIGLAYSRLTNERVLGAWTCRRSSNSVLVKPMEMKASAFEKGDDLLIVGAGVLGRLVAKEWLKINPDATVFGETRTDQHHDALKSLGIQPGLAGSTDPPPPYVVFCVPPSGTDDYVSAVSDAVARVETHGSRFIFTSSMSVYGNSSEISEDTPIVSLENGDGAASNPKLDRARELAKAENAVLSYDNGLVLRLTGLYTVSRGPHSYWIRAGTVRGSPEGVINLVHYEDAARAVVQALRVPSAVVAEWPRRSCLVCARQSVSRRDICDISLAHPEYKECRLPQFTELGNSTVAWMSRTFDNDWTRGVLDWTPQWESFVEFMKRDALIV